MSGISFIVPGSSQGQGGIADFDEATDYVVGNLVIFQNSLFQFTGDKAAGLWDPAFVTQIAGGGASRDPRYIVVPLGGQSNMVGYGEELPDPIYDGQDNRVKQLGRFVDNGDNFNKVIPATHCLHHTQDMRYNEHQDADMTLGEFTDVNPQAGTIGPGLYIGKALLPYLGADTDVLLVGEAFGGKGFGENDGANTWVDYPAGYDPRTDDGRTQYGAQKVGTATPNRWNAPDGNLYKDLIARTKAALDLDPRNFISFVVWNQGENDANTVANANAHKTAFKNLIDQFIIDLNANHRDQCPDGDAGNILWIVGSGTSWYDGNTTRQIVLDNYRELAEANDNITFVDFRDLTTNEDNDNPRDAAHRPSGNLLIHFNGAAYRGGFTQRTIEALAQYKYAPTAVRDDSEPIAHAYEQVVSSIVRAGQTLSITTEDSDGNEATALEDLSPTYADTAAGLVCLLRFDDPANPLKNDGDTDRATVTWEEGGTNRIVDVDGRKTKVFAPSATNKIRIVSDIPVGTDVNFTKAFTVYKNDDTTNQNIMSGGAGSLILWFVGADKITGYARYGANSQDRKFVTYTDPTGSTANKWYHVCHTYDSASETQRLYINGVQVAEKQVGGTINFTNQVIGEYAGQYYPFLEGGYIDTVRIYDRELSADEVAQISLEDLNEDAAPIRKAVETIGKTSAVFASGDDLAAVQESIIVPVTTERSVLGNYNIPTAQENIPFSVINSPVTDGNDAITVHNDREFSVRRHDTYAGAIEMRMLFYSTSANVVNVTFGMQTSTDDGANWVGSANQELALPVTNQRTERSFKMLVAPADGTNGTHVRVRFPIVADAIFAHFDAASLILSSVS